MTPKLAVAAIITVLGTMPMAGCDKDGFMTDPKPGSTVAPASGASRGSLRTIDDEHIALTALVPGFGGLYADEAETFHVYLTDPTVLGRFTTVLANFVVRLGIHTDPSVAPRFVAETARFDFRQLADMHGRIKALLPRTGITQTDIDDLNNRVVVGVLDTQHEQSVRQQLMQLGAPEGMIVLQVIPPTIVRQGTIRDYVNPVVGGVQITSDYGALCTLGYNARLQSTTNGLFYDDRYFITASHCTSSVGVVDGYNNGRTFGQPDAGGYIGAEAYDPSLFDSSLDPACRPGRACRYSDAVLARYSDSVRDSLGRIARIDGSATSPITSYPPIVSSATREVGQIILAQGRTSGMTNGTVLRICVDVVQYTVSGGNYVDHGVDMLCQSQASFSALGGDSGGPVFFYTRHPFNFSLRHNVVGLNWGSAPSDSYGDPFYGFDATYSTIGSVTSELAASTGLGVSVVLQCVQPMPGCP